MADDGRRARDIIDRLRMDRTSGASELVPSALEALKRTRDEGPEALVAAAQAVRGAQPSMAPLWNLAAAADREAGGEHGALDLFERRWRRAGPALVRAAIEVLAPPEGRHGRYVTCSFSGTVLACLERLARRAEIAVACGEGRPALEGRRMSAALGAAGVKVELFTDAALGLALPGADALVVGADAVSPAWFLNKCGTAALAAAALHAGVPTYVVATRDKLLDPASAALLSIDEHEPGEVWSSPAAGVTVRNPYFERVPADLLAGVVTDAGLLGVGMLEEACRPDVPPGARSAGRGR